MIPFPFFPEKHYDPVVCADGFKMSIQAGRLLRSIPRKTSSSYTHVEIECEVGDPLLDEFGCSGSDIYDEVPGRVVLDIISLHGGLVRGEIPPLNFSNKES